MDFTRAKFKIEDAASKLTKRHTKDSYIGLIKVNYIFAWASCNRLQCEPNVL